MKKVILILSAFFALNACSAQRNQKIKGNGINATIERSVGQYEDLEVVGFFDVFLVYGTEGNLALEGEENLLPYVITEVKNGTLKIRTERNITLKPSSFKKGIVITVPIQEINGASLSGSGDLIGKTPIKGEEFKVVLSGSGDVSLELETNKVKTVLSGSGDIALKGNTNDLEVTISGSGDVEAYGLQAEHAEVKVSGSADVYVTVNESLTTRVSGSGDVSYKGNPRKLDSKTTGSGSVSKG